jgi:hypothetical protein
MYLLGRIAGELVNRLAQPPPMHWLRVPQCSPRLSYSIEEIQNTFCASHHFIHHSSRRCKVLRSGHGKSRMPVKRIVGSSDRLLRKAESIARSGCGRNQVVREDQATN